MRKKRGKTPRAKNTKNMRKDKGTRGCGEYLDKGMERKEDKGIRRNAWRRRCGGMRGQADGEEGRQGDAKEYLEKAMRRNTGTRGWRRIWEQAEEEEESEV
jgi:hypothetical protein